MSSVCFRIVPRRQVRDCFARCYTNTACKERPCLGRVYSPMSLVALPWSAASDGEYPQNLFIFFLSMFLWKSCCCFFHCCFMRAKCLCVMGLLSFPSDFSLCFVPALSLGHTLTGLHTQCGGNKDLGSPVMWRFTFPCMGRWSESITSPGSNGWQIAWSAVLPGYTVLLMPWTALWPPGAQQNCQYGLLLCRLNLETNHHRRPLIYCLHF